MIIGWDGWAQQRAESFGDDELSKKVHLADRRVDSMDNDPHLMVKVARDKSFRYL